MRRRRFGLTVVIGLCLAVLPSWYAPGVAQAGEGEGPPPIGSAFGCNRPVSPPRCVSLGDNTRHFVHIDPSVPIELADAVRRVLAGAYEPSVLVLLEDSALTYRTDVIVLAADHGPNGAAGWTYCPPEAPQGLNAHGDRWCRHQELHFNLNAQYAAFFADDASRQYTACHELGHTLGLRHWGNPPESNGPVAATCLNADTPNGPVTLHENDRQRIDAYYHPKGCTPEP